MKSEVMQFHVEAREEDGFSLLGEKLKNFSWFDIWAATYRLTAIWMMKFTTKLDKAQQRLVVSTGVCSPITTSLLRLESWFIMRYVSLRRCTAVNLGPCTEG